jgi:hypothetical protein
MMPDYGGEAIYRIAGHTPAEALRYSTDLGEQLDAWVVEWENFHDCRVSDDTHEEWARRGRELHERAAAHYERFNVLLLADFEGTEDEQVARGKLWDDTWRERNEDEDEETN